MKQPSPSPALCPHVAACGGCTMQHLPDAAYAAAKWQRAATALAHAGLDAGVLAPLARTPAGQRRRLDFAVRRTADGVALGLHPPRSHAITTIFECRVLHPALLALLAPLRTLLPTVAGLRRDGALIANLLDSGPDLWLRLDGQATAGDRARLADFAARHGIPRIAVGTPPEPACQIAPVHHCFAGVIVRPPPGAFLQASAAGEAAIRAAVLAALPPRLRSVVELYAGIGTLSFPLAQRARVLAYEGDEAAFAALRQAAGGTRVATHHRDLARRPLPAPDLAGADAVVLDPPHAGAAAQIRALAAARTKSVIYVSCNPATFARDAATLVRGGFALQSIVPIDQFVWSDQLELVASFRRLA